MLNDAPLPAQAAIRTDLGAMRRHTLIKITEPAFQVPDKAERILTQ